VEIAAKRARITIREVLQLKLPRGAAARVLLWDDKISGFGVKVAPTGRKTYIVRYKWRGVAQTYTIGPHDSPWTPEEARERAKAVIQQVERGEDPKQKRREVRTGLTVAELIELWLRDGPISRPTKRKWSWTTDASRLRRHAMPLIGRMLIKEVKRRDIEFMQAEIARGATADWVRRKGRGRILATGGPLVAANVVQCVSAMYGWAIDQEMVEHNPCLRVKRAKANIRVRWLSDDETKRLVTTLDEMEAAGEINPSHLAILRLLLLTGARKTEISNLKWSEIDWDRRCIFLPLERSKTGQRDPIRLAAPALEILKARYAEMGDKDLRVFPAHYGGKATAVDVTWKKVRARAHLIDFRLHDLRHNAASVAVNEGVSLYVAGKLLGHKNAVTTERYAHVASDPVHKAAEAVASRILAKAKPKPPPQPAAPALTSGVTVSVRLATSFSYHAMIRPEGEP
jgi:integrase